MLVCTALNVLLIALLTALVVFQGTQMCHLYLFAICFGVVDGFFIPAVKSIIPTLVTEEQLAASNTLSQGMTQLIMLIDPVLGGLLIATTGIETALAIDTATFVFTFVMLLLMKSSLGQSAAMTKDVAKTYDLKKAFDSSIKKPSITSFRVSLITGVREGLNYAWHNPSLRIVLLIVIIVYFFFLSPLEVGSTSLAYNRFTGGAVTLGAMKSAWGLVG